MTAEAPVANPSEYQHKRWQTRPRPGVDRMSSAWLIRRFIDPHATFIFQEPSKGKASIPFDTFGAEFGHHGDRCTFETLAARFALTDPAVGQIARIVHDLDLKESPYREPATETIGRLVEGLRQSHDDDGALLSVGMDLFEALYHSLAAASPSPARRRRMSSQPGKTARGSARKRS